MALLTAARDGLPTSLGDREWIAAMDLILLTAIRGRIPFGGDDGASLREDHFQRRRCVGNFDPLHYGWYRKAVEMQSASYCAMWEAAHGMKPWRSPFTWKESGYLNITRLAGNARVAPGCAVTLPGSDDDPSEMLETADGRQVWWCTSQDAFRIVLCRYRASGRERASEFSHEGTPAARKTFNRDEWVELFPRAAQTSEIGATRQQEAKTPVEG
jgi:hypothetical protein